VNIAATDVDTMVQWAVDNAMDFVVVAPDDPLALGMVDRLEAAGIRAFGPRQNAAILEASKAFSKELMRKYHIPTAKYATFTDESAALAYLSEQGAPIVVKADGLALGKGVTVAATVEEAKNAVREMMEEGKFGASGSTVVIEECMTGPEVTVLAFADGEHVVPMPSSQDHKRAYDGDKGPNTGGMGAFSPSPNYTPEVARRCMDEIFLPTMAAMKAEGRPFQGVLYFGLMLTPDGPKVVEYNARFGDPETQPLLMRLESDLFEIFNACVDGTLDQIDIRWKEQAACCLVLASGGYPLSYEKGHVISGLDQVKDAMVFHAGTKRNTEGQFVNNGGRVLGVTALGDSLPEAVANAYAAARPISWKDMHFRTDIGRK
jgi:phosphoribosylamine--glycine ligase